MTENRKTASSLAEANIREERSGETEPTEHSQARRVRPTAKRQKRLRSHRIKVDDLALERLTATGTHASLGSFESRVDDISLHGIRLVISRPSESGLVLSGDRLESLSVETDDLILYRGEAVVRRVSEAPGEFVLGVEVRQRAIDLEILHRLNRRTSLGEKLRSAAAEQEAVSAEYKAWVAELCDFMVTTKKVLDHEEASLGETDRWTREESLRDFVHEAAPIVSERLNRASQELAALVSDLSDEEHSVYRSFYRRHLCKFYHRSPLLSRAYHKPLGYAGDYEMMNMLYRDHAEGDTLFGRVMNVYACQEPAAQANINRIEYLSRRIEALVNATPDRRIRIASIGCGPSREIRTLLDEYPELGSRLDIALVDQEEKAIEYCERTLSRLAAETGARIQFIDESIRRLLTAHSLGAALGTRDLIYSAGLFDYLGDRSFEALLAVLHGATAPGGHLYIGNVNGETNTSKWSMEYGSDWYLNHRTSSQLLEFAGTLKEPTLVEVESEPLGVNLFLHVVK